MTILSLLTGVLGSTAMASDISTPLMTAPQPGEVPVGDYTGQYRPQVHFSPPTVSQGGSLGYDTTLADF
jgi:hypothetical protein